MKLTPKQKAFCQYYIASGNAGQSYIDAGYSAPTMNTAYVNANKLLRNHKIKSYIDQQMLSKDNERIASADEVLAFLTSVQRGEVTEQTPLVLGKEFKVIDKEPSIKDRTKAAELLGKRYSLFTEKHELSGSLGLSISVDYGTEGSE